jgi:hypothetical protein
MRNANNQQSAASPLLPNPVLGAAGNANNPTMGCQPIITESCTWSCGTGLCGVKFRPLASLIAQLVTPYTGKYRPKTKTAILARFKF